MTTTVPALIRQSQGHDPEFDDRDPLSWVLGLDASESFLSEVLDQQALHCENSRRDRFHGLLSMEVLDTVLGTYGLRRPDIKLVNFDRDIAPEEFEWRGMVDPARVGRLFADGATVIFGGLQDRHEPLRRLCSTLTRQANARTQTNIYLTPPHSQGFKPHWDTHDVFVLQVEGSKRWRIYEGGPQIPLVDQKFDPAQHSPGEVVSEFTLQAGETLYIPRGIMHAADSADDTSLHITLGLIAYSWAELLGQCIAESAIRSPRWRENVPFGYGSEAAKGFPEMKGELRERLAGLADEVDLESVLLARMHDVDDAYRPRAADFMRQARAAGDLSPDDVVHARPDISCRLETRAGRVVVTWARKEVDFPGVAERAVSRVLLGGPIRAGDIDDRLDWAGRHTVISALIREGLVVRSAAGGA